jgi:hypothetical protein
VSDELVKYAKDLIHQCKKGRYHFIIKHSKKAVRVIYIKLEIFKNNPKNK